MMQALFTLDGFTDVEPAPVVREIAFIVMDAFRNPDKPRPAGEVILGEMMRQCVHTHHKSVVRSTADLTVSFFGRCWTRVNYTATPQARKHFLATMEGLLNAFVAQAEDRGNNTIRSVESYFELRRETIGMGPSYFIGELHLSIPDEAYYHPVVRELECLAADMIAMDNVRSSGSSPFARCSLTAA